MAMTGEKGWDFTVTWRIDNYSSSPLKTGECIMSPEFNVEALDNCKWYLSVYPSGWKDTNKEDLNCFLHKSKDNKSENESDITYKFQISTEHEKLFMSNQISSVFEKGVGKGSTDCIKLEDLTASLTKCSSDTVFIKCWMKRTEKSEKLSVESELQTRVVSHKCSFEWEVKFLKDSEYIREKSYFSLGNHFYQINFTIPSDDVIITVQKLKVNDISDNAITGKIALLDVNGKELFWKRDTKTIDVEFGKTGWEFPCLITKKDLIDNVNKLVKEEKLLLLCEFSLCKMKKSKDVPKPNFHILDSLISLSDDFRGLLVNKTSYDVKLLFENNVELMAHRSVLAARSPVFCAMFDKEMIENQTGVIKIEDMDSNTVKSFLEFLYTGAVENLDCEIAIQLLLVADKYQVPTLKDACADFLMPALSVDNACEILTKADMIHHESLKNACLNFAAHHVTKIFSAPDIANWIKENPKLSAEITLCLGKTVETVMNK